MKLRNVAFGVSAPVRAVLCGAVRARREGSEHSAVQFGRKWMDSWKKHRLTIAYLAQSSTEKQTHTTVLGKESTHSTSRLCDCRQRSKPLFLKLG